MSDSDLIKTLSTWNNWNPPPPPEGEPTPAIILERAPPQLAKNPCADWDITIPEKATCLDFVINWMREWCKKWSFQLEKGNKEGYEHYQCRVSLKKKTRTPTALGLTLEAHWTTTALVNRGNNFYVTKLDTRIDGPWKDDDPEPMEEPEEIKGLDPKPWQHKVIDSWQEHDGRKIGCIMDMPGGAGKSWICDWVMYHKIGWRVPYCKDYKDVMGWVLGLEERYLYLIDLPRAVNKKHLDDFISGLETLKDGWAFDMRYKPRQRKWKRRPALWIFTNQSLAENKLSSDKLVYYNIVNNDLKQITEI